MVSTSASSLPDNSSQSKASESGVLIIEHPLLATEEKPHGEWKFKVRFMPPMIRIKHEERAIGTFSGTIRTYPRREPEFIHFILHAKLEGEGPLDISKDSEGFRQFGEVLEMFVDAFREEAETQTMNEYPGGSASHFKVLETVVRRLAPSMPTKESEKTPGATEISAQPFKMTPEVSKFEPWAGPRLVKFHFRLEFLTGSNNITKDKALVERTKLEIDNRRWSEIRDEMMKRRKPDSHDLTKKRKAPEVEDECDETQKSDEQDDKRRKRRLG